LPRLAAVLLVSANLIFDYKLCFIFWEEFIATFRILILPVYLGNCILFSGCIWNIGHINSVSFASTAGLLIVFYIRAKECYRLFEEFCRVRFSHWKYAQIRQFYFKTLIFFLRVNRMYGKLFLISVLIYMPINAQIATWLLQGQVSSRLVALAFVGYQINFLFAFHLGLTYKMDPQTKQNAHPSDGGEWAPFDRGYNWPAASLLYTLPASMNSPMRALGSFHWPHSQR